MSCPYSRSKRRCQAVWKSSKNASVADDGRNIQLLSSISTEYLPVRFRTTSLSLSMAVNEIPDVVATRKEAAVECVRHRLVAEECEHEQTNVPLHLADVEYALVDELVNATNHSVINRSFYVGCL